VPRAWTAGAAAGCLLVGLSVGGCERRHPPVTELSELLPASPGLNFLVVSFDALRADALGIYGGRPGLTPHLDELARESVVFDAAYAAGQATPSSFASAFTGQWPFKALRGWQVTGSETLNRLFREGGFEAATVAPSLQLDLAGFEDRLPVELQPLETRDERTLETATGWLAEHRGERFLLWVHFHDPHMPYFYRPMAREFYSEDALEPYQALATLNPAATDPATLPADDRRRLRELYEGQVHYVDSLFGRLMKQVETLGLARNTLVIATADHGEELGDHGRYVHWQLYDEVIRIPLIVRHPVVRQRSRAGAPVSNVDFLPTLLGLARLPIPSGLDGRSFASRESAAGRSVLAVQMTEPEYWSVAVRQDEWKLICWCAGGDVARVELFDLGVDPGENSDLAATEPDAVRRLVSALREKVGGAPCTVIQAAVRGVELAEGADDETIEALRTLGYVE
jgi:choline-sulfatase